VTETDKRIHDVEERFKLWEHGNGAAKERSRSLGNHLNQKNREIERFREQTLPQRQFEEVSGDLEYTKRDLEKYASESVNWRLDF
jgi:hypothetical protein